MAEQDSARYHAAAKRQSRQVMSRKDQNAMQTKPGTLKATAYHEAGHAMAAWQLEIPLGKGKHVLSIVTDGSAQGHCQYKNMLSCHNIDVSPTGGDRLKMERMAIVKLAGLVAQRRHRPSSLRSWQGSSDFHSAVGLVSCFTGSDRETEAYLNLLQIRAEQIIDRPHVWECVEALASTLLERKDPFRN
jgi:hypothetical protein